MAKSATSLEHYVAFLRGINVGGNKIIKMDALKAAFEQAGMKGVKTVLASGNVLFEAADQDTGAVTRKIEARLEQILGHKIGIVLRTIRELEALEKRNPFQGVRVTPETRLYVTFLREAVKGKRELTNVIQLSQDRGTLDMMEQLDKEYGKSITTRNWNTIGRILKAARNS